MCFLIRLFLINWVSLKVMEIDWVFLLRSSFLSKLELKCYKASVTWFQGRLLPQPHPHHGQDVPLLSLRKAVLKKVPQGHGKQGGLSIFFFNFPNWWKFWVKFSTNCKKILMIFISLIQIHPYNIAMKLQRLHFFNQRNAKFMDRLLHIPLVKVNFSARIEFYCLFWK
jgi:hypothetical protein